jgi:hypothetical protein
MLLDIDFAKSDPITLVNNSQEMAALVKRNHADWSELYGYPDSYPCYAVFGGNIWNSDDCSNTCVFTYLYPTQV